MNCLEFRRHLLIWPDSRDADVVGHERECEACRAYADRTHDFEERLVSALSVQPPAGMAAQIKQRRAAGDDFLSQRLRPWQFAVAASVLLMLSFVGTRVYNEFGASAQDSQLQQAVLEHMYEEEQFLTRKVSVDPATVNLLLSSFKGKLDADLGDIRFAGHCIVGGNKGVHLVVAGQQGPVTIIYVDKPVDRTMTISDERFHGMVSPTGEGSLVIMGEYGEPLHEVSARVSNGLEWLS